MPTNKKPFTVVQITDTHLFSDASTELKGYCTHQLLADTIDHILLNVAMPDIALVTGDISQDETAGSYQLALAQFERLGCPVVWIAGNHDNEEQINRSLGGASRLKNLATLSTPFWEFISINTCRAGTDKGYIEDAEYENFLSKLTASKKEKKHIAVVMHHHPVPVNTPLIDEYILQQRERFLALARQHKEIKLVICGHVHGDYAIAYHQLVVEACPATCFQWEKGTGKMAVVNTRGYKIFSFGADSYTASTIYI